MCVCVCVCVHKKADSEEVVAAQRRVEAVIQRVGQGVKGAVQGAVDGVATTKGKQAGS